MPLLMPPGAWHPPGHGAWHGRVGAGPGGSEGKREEGEERGSGSRRGLRREMSSPRQGWVGWGPGWASSRRQRPPLPTPEGLWGWEQVGPHRRARPPPHPGANRWSDLLTSPESPHAHTRGAPHLDWCLVRTLLLSPLPPGGAPSPRPPIWVSLPRVTLATQGPAETLLWTHSQFSGTTFLTPILLLTGTPILNFPCFP